MQTSRLYQADRYLTQNTAVITGTDIKDGKEAVTCSRSVFYPEGGGQPTDTGTISSGGRVHEVIRAYDHGLSSDVWHLTDAEPGTFSIGDEVTLSIDWNNRFRNMQRHCGEHMLSGAMHELFGGVNKGFHMGSGFITIDIDLDGRMLTEEELDLAEKTVNDAIWADLPVTVSWFDDYEASLALPVRKAVPHEGRVSIVTVGDLDDPFDCIACCGTHPASSAEVGLLAIYKCEPNKGMNRIYFDCGAYAKERLSADSRLLAEVAKRYSCHTADLIARLDAEAASASALRARLSSLSSYVRDNEKLRILAGIAAAGSRVYTYSSDILSTDDLLKLGFAVMESAPDKVLIFTHPESLTCMLFSSGDPSCGRFIKENVSRFSGRGGGRDDNARALFTSASDLEDFARAAAEML